MRATRLCAVSNISSKIQPYVAEQLDQTFNMITNSLREPCFTQGWGNQKLLAKLMELASQSQASENYTDREKLITKNIDFTITDETIKKKEGIKVLTGRFTSPASYILPEEITRDCIFQMVIPVDKPKERIPLVIQYAMTADHGFSRRNDIGMALLNEHKIASLSILNPYYGLRKPANQKRSSLLYVSDLMCKGVALVSEGLSLFEYFKVNDEIAQFGPFGVTGISMGGHMAALAVSFEACNSTEPIAVIPCLSPYSAGPVFTQGLLSNWCNWKKLDEQLPNYLNEKQKSQNMTSKDYMNYLLDYTTDITRFPKPRCMDSTIQVAAKYDKYVPGTGYVLHDYWKGSELRWTEYSHVSAIILGQKTFVSAIADAFKRLPS